jgi:hypothetical protein
VACTCIQEIILTGITGFASCSTLLMDLSVFLKVLQTELRAPHLLGRCSTIWMTLLEWAGQGSCLLYLSRYMCFCSVYISLYWVQYIKLFIHRENTIKFTVGRHRRQMCAYSWQHCEKRSFPNFKLSDSKAKSTAILWGRMKVFPRKWWWYAIFTFLNF